MATELAAAYLTIIPSMKGAKKQIQNQLGDIDVDGVSGALGKKMASGIS